MSELFGRAYRISLGSVEIDNLSGTGLRVQFEVRRDKRGLGAPNTATVSVYGLSEDTRQQLHDQAAGEWVSAAPTLAQKLVSIPQIFAPGIKCRIEAGWGDTVDQIYSGVLREVWSEKQGPEWITTATAADGEKECKMAKISKTWAMGTPLSQVFLELVNALGIEVGNLLTAPALMGPLALPALPGAMTLKGYAAEEFDWLMKSCDLEWSIQDGALQVMQRGSAADFFLPAMSPVLAPDSGLIGGVRVDTKEVATGKALLIGGLIPGRAFRIDSDGCTGNFRCLETKHVGDSHAPGESWIVEFAGDPL